ncbi:hypothetical protein ACFC1R_23655 [Kitasatospora sp. NPDC056138]|uniref:hypothetical protein n=1 Tax=Kitasatospora sp. NPDC056138 TaxID=3345724 RepID=UPI0035DDB2AE
MLPSPALRIVNEPGAGVIAEGSWDELSGALLHRAGFLPVSTIRSSWWRVPHDLEPAEENEIATHAYEMLTAARYEVSIAPELRFRPSTAAREIKSLASEIRRSDSPEAVTELLAVLSDPDHGVLPGLSNLLTDAATWADRQPPGEVPISVVAPLSRAAGALDLAQSDLAEAERDLSLPPAAARAGRSAPVASSGEPMVAAARARSTAADGPATGAPQPAPTTAPVVNRPTGRSR